MKSSVLALIVTTLAASALAEDEKPRFNFWVDIYGPSMDADDFVELPYEREGFHKKCISHPKEITSLSLGGYYDEDYCWYGFNETAMCEGRPSEMEKLPAHSGNSMFLLEQGGLQSSVIQEGVCPEIKPDVIPV